MQTPHREPLFAAEATVTKHETNVGSSETQRKWEPARKNVLQYNLSPLDGAKSHTLGLTCDPLNLLSSSCNASFGISPQLGNVSLALFRTLIGLYCEDVMLQLVLR